MDTKKSQFDSKSKQSITPFLLLLIFRLALAGLIAVQMYHSYHPSSQYHYAWLIITFFIGGAYLIPLIYSPFDSAGAIRIAIWIANINLIAEGVMFVLIILSSGILLYVFAKVLMCFPFDLVFRFILSAMALKTNWKPKRKVLTAILIGYVIVFIGGGHLVTAYEIGFQEILRYPNNETTIMQNSSHGDVNELLLSSDKTTIATYTGSVITVRSVNERQILWQAKSSLAEISTIAYTPDGQYLVAGGYKRNIQSPNVEIWDAKTGTGIKGDQTKILPEGENADILKISFHPSGKLVAYETESELKVYNPLSGEVNVLSSHKPRRTAELIGFIPNGKLLMNSFPEIRLLDVETKQTLFEQEMKRERYSCFSFTPDGQYLALGYYSHEKGNVIYIINTQSNELSKTIYWNKTQQINGVSYSPDGNYIAAVGNQPYVQIWNAQTGEKYKLLGELPHQIGKSVSYSLDGRYLFTGGQDGIIKVWQTEFYK